MDVRRPPTAVGAQPSVAAEVWPLYMWHAMSSTGSSSSPSSFVSSVALLLKSQCQDAESSANHLLCPSHLLSFGIGHLGDFPCLFVHLDMGVRRSREPQRDFPLCSMMRLAVTLCAASLLR